MGKFASGETARRNAYAYQPIPYQRLGSLQKPWTPVAPASARRSQCHQSHRSAALYPQGLYLIDLIPRLPACQPASLPRHSPTSQALSSSMPPRTATSPPLPPHISTARASRSKSFHPSSLSPSSLVRVNGKATLSEYALVGVRNPFCFLHEATCGFWVAIAPIAHGLEPFVCHRSPLFRTIGPEYWKCLRPSVTLTTYHVHITSRAEQLITRPPNPRGGCLAYLPNQFGCLGATSGPRLLLSTGSRHVREMGNVVSSRSAPECPS